MDGELFVAWHDFDHPTLGEVEIGGWKRRKTSPPEGQLIQKECEMGNAYVIYLAGQAAKIALGEPEIADKEGGIYQLDITVENKGFLPTATQQAVELEMVEPVLLEVVPNENVEILLGETKVRLGQIDGLSESDKTTYILRVKDSSRKAVLEVQAKSQRAGKDSREVVINN